MLEIHPSRSEVDRLVPPLNGGERRTLAWLEEILGEDDSAWHLYVQPKLLNRQPDFLAISPDHGVYVLEVKDWQPGAYRPDLQRSELQVRDPKHGWTSIAADPLKQAYDYRQLVGSLLSPPGSDYYSVIKAIVVLPRIPKIEAARLLDTTTSLTQPQKRPVAVLGCEDLDRCSSLPRRDLRRSELPIDAQVFDRFQARLAEPDAIARARRPLELSPGARNVADNPNNARVRRVRGPAGSGKTLGVAARAARLAAQDKTVLVLTFNITLAHYVQDAVRRHARSIGAPHRNVDTIHFHGFCKGILGKGGDPHWMVQETMRRYEQDRDRVLPRYDAILVDEGQDFEQHWWNFLRREVLSNPEQGEMLLVIDTSQGLYGRRGWGDEASMPGCGFSGGWTRLEGSYRLPADLIPFVRDYVTSFLEVDDELIPVQPDGRMLSSLNPTRRRWIEAGRLNEAAIIATAADSVEQMLADDPTLHPGDVVVLANHPVGERIMTELTRRGHTNEHIFDEDEEEQRRRKLRFWAGTPHLKGCTVHSYKGWESRGVVLVLLEDANSETYRQRVPDEILGYVALTRVAARHDRGSSHITVITDIPVLADFSRRFERELTIEERGQILGQLELGDTG